MKSRLKRKGRRLGPGKSRRFGASSWRSAGIWRRSNPIRRVTRLSNGRDSGVEAFDDRRAGNIAA